MQQPSPSAEVVARIEKPGGESVAIVLDQFGGTQLVHARLHYRDASGADRPTARGFSLTVDRLPELRAAIQAAETEATRRGLLPPAGGGRP